MLVISAYKTDTGVERTHNEDYVWVNQEMGIYIVADGLGGHEAGDVASRMAATTIGELIETGLKEAEKSAEAIKTLITNAIETANQTVSDASVEASQRRPMGATIVMAIVQPPVAYVAHAGDARAYLIHNKKLTRLTKDDSWVAQLVAAGMFSEADARRHDGLHLITKAVGQGEPVEPAFAEIPVTSGDCLLLCSDGLWNMVEDEDILALLFDEEKDNFEQNNLEPVVNTLIDAANFAGGKDNIAIILAKVVEEIEH